jgi:hypothetical protein
LTALLNCGGRGFNTKGRHEAKIDQVFHQRLPSVSG